MSMVQLTSPDKWEVEIIYIMSLWTMALILGLYNKKIGEMVRLVEDRRKMRPRRSYLGKRGKISRYLDENQDTTNNSRFDCMFGLVKEIVVSDLKKPLPAFLIKCNVTDTKKDNLRGEVKNLYEKIFKPIKENNRKWFNKALRFEVKSRMVKFPHDIQGHRRAFEFETVFDELWENNNTSCFGRWKEKVLSLFSSLSNLSCNCSCFGVLNSCCQRFMDKLSALCSPLSCNISNSSENSSCFKRLKEKFPSPSLSFLTCNCCSPKGSYILKMIDCHCQETSSCSCTFICSWPFFSMKPTCDRTNRSDCSCSITCSWRSSLCCRSKVQTSTKYGKFSIIKAIIKFVVATLGLIGWDYYGDLRIIATIWNLSIYVYAQYNTAPTTTTEVYTVNATNTNDTTIIDDIIKKLVDPGNLMYPVLVLILILLISTCFLLADNPVKSMLRQVQTSVKMGSAKVEENDECLSISSIVKRYDLPISEAGVESRFQITYQWGLYFSVALLLSIATLFDIDLPTVDNFLKFDILYMSGVAAVASLTMAQIKSNNVQHEYNMTWIQQAVYFLSSLANTISSTMLLINAATGAFDFGNVLFFLIFHNITSPAVRVLLGGLVGLAILIIPIIILISISTFTPAKLNILPVASIPKTLFSSLLLPTSQLQAIVGYRSKGVLSYHSSIRQSPNLLNMIRSQFLTYIALIIVTIVLNISHYAAIEFDSSFIALSNATSNPAHFTPAYFGRARYNLMLHSSYGIPAGLLLSYLFLQFYFTIDRGYLSVANLEFEYKSLNKEEGETEVKQNLEEDTPTVVEEHDSQSEHEEIELLINLVTKESNDQTDGYDGPIESSNQECSWIDTNFENDTKNPWYLRDWFGVRNCCGIRDHSCTHKWFCIRCFPKTRDDSIQDKAVHGVWRDLAGNDGSKDSDTDEDVPDEEIPNSIKSSFYFFDDANSSSPTASSEPGQMENISLDGENEPGQMEEMPLDGEYEMNYGKDKLQNGEDNGNLDQRRKILTLNCTRNALTKKRAKEEFFKP